jgi:hypothetical protein
LQDFSNVLAFHADRQRPVVDISPKGQSFDIRITGLVGRRRPLEIEDEYFVLDPEARAAEVSAWEHDQLFPPIRLSIELADLAFRNTTFAVDDGFWHHNAIPIPVVFTRVGKGEPCAGVWFHPEKI